MSQERILPLIPFWNRSDDSDDSNAEFNEAFLGVSASSYTDVATQTEVRGIDQEIQTVVNQKNQGTQTEKDPYPTEMVIQDLNYLQIHLNKIDKQIKSLKTKNRTRYICNSKMLKSSPY